MTGKNTMKLPVILAVMVLLSLFAVSHALSEGNAVSEVQRAIGDAGASWTAGETSVSGYSLEDKLRLCGAKIGPLPDNSVMLVPPADRKVAYGTFDWRNVSGEDWMTSVKEQGPCGSCWVFGATGAFEAQINIDSNDPGIDFDSSEQNILSCSGGGDCEEGGWVNATLKYIRDIGVPDEECLRYRANDTIPCNDTCSDWQERAWTCERIGVPVCHRTECYKWILEDYGPMVVVLNVTEDLFYYTGGIYESVWSSDEFAEADHGVVLVGYDDPNECWIIKNSWSQFWGENGYGRIRYGELEKHERVFVVIGTRPLHADATIAIENASVPEGSSVTVPINVTGVSDLCAANVWLHYNSSVATVENVVDGDMGHVTYHIENDPGVTKMVLNTTDETTDTVTDDFVFAYVTLKAVGSAGDTSPLGLEVREFCDCDVCDIRHNIVNGTLEVTPSVSGLMEGDVNMDGCVSLKDSTAIKLNLVGGMDLDESQRRCADTNDDSEVTMKDSTLIRKWLVDPSEGLWQSPEDDDMDKPVACE